MRLALLLFVKAPQVGAVKSRLGKTIGPAAAADLYRCFGREGCDRLRQFCRDWPAQLLIFFAPATAEGEVRAWLEPRQDEGVVAQVDGDLGDRLAAAFVDAWRRGFEQAIVLGSDSPDLPLDRLARAAAALATHDAALIPTVDGGYCALGFRRSGYAPTVFVDIPWSSAAVSQLTQARLRAAGRSWALLPGWYDLDEWPDVLAWRSRSQARPELAQGLARTRAKLEQVIEQWKASNELERP